MDILHPYDYTLSHCPLVQMAGWDGRFGLGLYSLHDGLQNSCRELENKPRHLRYITVSITAKFNTNEEAEFLRPYILLAALNTDHRKIKLMSL